MKISLEKSKIKILLLEGVHESAIEAFEQQGYTNIELYPGSLSQEDLIKKISDIHILGIRSRTQVNAEVMAAARKLIAIGCFCIGTNQVSLIEALKKRYRCV